MKPAHIHTILHVCWLRYTELEFGQGDSLINFDGYPRELMDTINRAIESALTYYQYRCNRW